MSINSGLCPRELGGRERTVAKFTPNEGIGSKVRIRLKKDGTLGTFTLLYVSPQAVNPGRGGSGNTVGSIRSPVHYVRTKR